MSSISGLGLSGPVNLLLAFVVVLILIGVIAWLIRRITRERRGSAARTRQPRLAVLDTVAVDARRQLVIIRRDNIEHLLMIGGGSDLVIETNIVRANPANAGRDNASRTTGALDAARTSPVYEGASWPAPQPEASVRLQRTSPVEDPPQWPASVRPEPALRTDKPAPVLDSIVPPQSGSQEPSVRTQRSTGYEFSTFRETPVQPNTGFGPAAPPLRATPADRPATSQPGLDAPGISAAPTPQPTAPPANVAARLAARLDPPQRQAPPESQATGMAARTPVQPTMARAEEVDTPMPTEREGAETPTSPESRPKPAAGPRFSFPNLKFERSAPSRAAPPLVKVDRPAARLGPATAPPERGQARPKSKTLYESLEQEMASLLGKPPGKP
jgi:flagellar protein FliO/FliZ